MSSSTPSRLTIWRVAIVAATALTALPLLSAPARALPAGGTVTGGNVTIGQPSNGSLTVDQTSNRGAIDWHSFSIGQNESVRFNLPNSSAISFNRVTGPDPSKIMGNLSSNGQVWLMNPNGVLFGGSARVDTSGLVASTASMTPAAFMAGSNSFSLSGRADATIVNEGMISIANGGLAAFVAPGVRNSGVIEAKVGKVALASGNRFTLDFYGDGLVNLAVDDKIAGNLVGPDGKPLQARVDNAGTIKAGSVVLTTNAASQVVDSLINVSGTIQARGARMEGGRIVLQGDGGTVTVAGALDATGAGIGQKGGTVQVSGERVVLDSTAQVDVSGQAGGGSALIGGDVLGKGSVPTARRTVIATGATIKADATRKGNGGKVVVWSDEDTRFGGSISANGGQSGGNGGFAEVSGKSLQFAGDVTLAAAAGEVGTLLLDPANIRITANQADSGGPGNSAKVKIAAGDVDTDPASQETRLYYGDLAGKKVVLAASNDISVDAPINVARLNLDAGNDINVNASVTSSGSIRMKAGQDINLNGTLTSAGKISLNSTRETRVNMSINANTLSIKSDAGFITGDGVITVADGTTLDAQRISLTGGSDSGGTGNFLHGPIDISTTARALLWNATDTVLRNINVGGDLVINQTAGSVTQIAPVDGSGRDGIAVGGLLDIDARGNRDGITLTRNNTIGSLSARTAGDLNFTGARSFALDTIDIAGNMTLSGVRGGFVNVTQVEPTDEKPTPFVRVGGNTVFGSRLFSVTLDQGDNNFVGTVTLANGTPTTLRTVGLLTLTGNLPELTLTGSGGVTLVDVTVDTLRATIGGALTFAGEAGVVAKTLTATAGSVSQTAALTVDGPTSITATNGGVALGNAGNQFGGTDGSTVALNGSRVTLGGTVTGNVDIGGLLQNGNVVLAGLTTRAGGEDSGFNGDLTIHANDVSQTDVLVVGGKTSISAASATLMDTENNFIGRVSLKATGPLLITGVRSGVFAIADRNNLGFDSITATRVTLRGNGGSRVFFDKPIDMPKGIMEINRFGAITINAGGSIGQVLGGGLASQPDNAPPLFIGGQVTAGSFPFKSNPLAELTSASGLVAAFAATANDDFVRRLGKGEVSQTPAENAIEYRPEYEGYATNPFTPRYDLLGFDRGDPRAASFARNTPYVLDGFWEGLLR